VAIREPDKMNCNGIDYLGKQKPMLPNVTETLGKSIGNPVKMQKNAWKFSELGGFFQKINKKELTRLNR
jgi:hypothetical protein